jgi:hypothetical protein
LDEKKVISLLRPEPAVVTLWGVPGGTSSTQFARTCPDGSQRETPGCQRSEETLDKPAHRHHNEKPQKYKGNKTGSNEYRSDNFHHAPYRDYLICL